MKTLDTKQKKHLKSLAHKLKPVVLIGQHGLTEAVLHEINNALCHHELIKVKISGADKSAKQMIIHTIVEHLSCIEVQLIGHTVIFYKKNIEEQKIKLP